jgi:histone-lysine N-methyltransferase SETD3
MGKDTPVGKKMLEHNLDLLSPKHCFLSTFLLLEKANPESFWRPYLDMLPQDYNSFPIFFSESDLDWLEGSPFLSK